ncbi:MAG: RecX family transcriptional regulator [Dehalococcoidia bacterium]
MTITQLQKQKSGKRFNLYVDGEFALALDASLVLEQKLHEGDDLTPARLRLLREKDAREAAYKSALRLLSYRPRSEQELRKRLRLKKMNNSAVEFAVKRLRRNGLIDDEAFARFYVDTRPARSRRMVTYELTSKGVPQETASEATEPIDDLEAAYRAAEKKARRMSVDDTQVFRRRLTSFLGSRGFSYAVILRTIERLADERLGDTAEGHDDR